MLNTEHRSSHRDVPGGSGLASWAPISAGANSAISQSPSRRNILPAVVRARAWFWPSPENGKGKRKKIEKRRKKEKALYPSL